MILEMICDYCFDDSGVAHVAKIFFCDLDDRELDVGDDEDIAKVHLA